MSKAYLLSIRVLRAGINKLLHFLAEFHKESTNTLYPHLKEPMMTLDMFTLASHIGGIAFALSGFLVGVRKGLDAMGIFIVTMMTANGGGAVRDVLVGRLPVVLTDSMPFFLTLAVIIVAVMLGLHRRKTLEQSHLFVLSDAVGLVAFSITGALVGIEVGLHIFGVMALSFITAAGGGIIRDVLVNDVPALFSSGFYGTVALLTAAVLYGLHHLGWQGEATIAAVFAGALVLRIIALWRGWSLPRVKL